MMKLYLDLCVYNRPFDDQHQERIALETSAFIYILEKVEKGEYRLVVSEALAYENTKNPDELRRLRLTSYFCLAKDFIRADYEDSKRGRYLITLGFSAMDALHLALAEKQNVDYFITCDDSIIKLYRKHQGIIKVRVVSLLEFIDLEVK